MKQAGINPKKMDSQNQLNVIANGSSRLLFLHIDQRKSRFIACVI